MKALLKKLVDNILGRRVDGALSRLREYDEYAFTHRVAESLRDEADRRKLSEAARHYLLYSIQREMYPKFVIADHSRMLLEDADFMRTFERYSDENWTSYERKWNLRELVRLVDEVPGHFAECGVFRGGSAHLLCDVAGPAGREVHLFDSFAGLSQPSAEEGDYWQQGDLSVSEDQVRENLGEFDCFRTFKGWIPERFVDVGDAQYAFVHIDVDLEQPTHDSLEFFYPRVPGGGIILLDDHGVKTCPGARRAALQYFAQRPEPVIDLATGQGLVIKRASS